MDEPGFAAPPVHLIDDAPSEAATWTQKHKNKTHTVDALLSKLKSSKAVRPNFRAMVDINLKKVVIACVMCWATAGVGVMLCTDGWRHRRAGHAHPLLNLVLLKPSGGCYFYDCYPLDKGAKKTAQFYADMHESLAMKVQHISKVLSDCDTIRNALQLADHNLS
ncbi:hypothetical protein V8C86DRAFT_2440939 [Haematococcus lacustris]